MYDFWKYSPSGNPTVFLRAEDFSVAQYSSIASRLMNPLHLGAEQVGYIYFVASTVLVSSADTTNTANLPTLAIANPTTMAHLQMMGGEFCLNATRAFAVLLAENGNLGLSENGQYSGFVSVSGSAEPVFVTVLQEEDSTYAKAELTFKEVPEIQVLEENIFRINLPGISHIILTKPVPENWKEQAYAFLDEYGKNEDAIGFMWLDSENNLFPVVYVRQTQSMCEESACGSGTLACAFLRYKQHKQQGQEKMSFLQPSQENLQVIIEQKNAMISVSVGGIVHKVAQGKIYF